MTNIKVYTVRLEEDLVETAYLRRDVRTPTDLFRTLLVECAEQVACKGCYDKAAENMKLRLDIALLKKLAAAGKLKQPMPDSDDMRVLFPGVSDEFVDNVLTGMGVETIRWRVIDLTDEQWRQACKKLGC